MYTNRMEAYVAESDNPGSTGDDSPYRDALEVLILTAAIAKAARQDTEQRLKQFGADLTGPQYRLLRQLQQESSTIKALSRSMMVEPATLVPMVDTLERHGFIRRSVDPRDRRRTPLELTDAGRERLDQVPFIHKDDPIARYLRQLPEEERQSFLSQLRNLARILHGHDQGVQQITAAVKAYFDFGQLITEHQHPQERPTQRRARSPRKEESST
jgi:DNA-binding MarR family transcriptional regulator